MLKRPILLMLALGAGASCTRNTGGQEPASSDYRVTLDVEPGNRTSLTTPPEHIILRLGGEREYTMPIPEVLEVAELTALSSGTKWALAPDDEYATIPEVYSGEFLLYLKLPPLTDDDYELRLQFKSWGQRVLARGSARGDPVRLGELEHVYSFSISARSFFVERLWHCPFRFGVQFSEVGGANLDEIEEKIRVTASGQTVNCRITELSRQSSSGGALMFDCPLLASPLRIGIPPGLITSIPDGKFLASHTAPTVALTELTGADKTPEDCVVIDRP